MPFAECLKACPDTKPLGRRRLRRVRGWERVCGRSRSEAPTRRDAVPLRALCSGGAHFQRNYSRKDSGHLDTALPGICASKLGRALKLSIRLVASAVDSGGVYCVDDHTRRGVSRAARFLPAAVEICEIAGAAKVFLPVHLRVLFQPLCRRGVSVHNAVQTSLYGLARVSRGAVCAGLGGESIHGHL
jgi:hypothetical protein